MNNTTRKHPRTLQQAFGPYTDNVIHEPKKSLFENLPLWTAWFAEHRKPETAESYQEAAIKGAEE